MQLPATGLAGGGDRTISFANMHTKETLTVTYVRNGRHVPEALKKINHMLRDWRRNEAIEMDPSLIDLVYDVHQELGSHAPVTVVSGYRSPVTNAALRGRSRGVAKHSQHMLGKAMDLYFPDVPLERIREVALKFQSGGVGYYPTSGRPFVHIDTGSVRHWPRMSRQQLAKLFPDGDTLHIPADGKPLTRSVRTHDILVAANESTSRGRPPRPQQVASATYGDPSMPAAFADPSRDVIANRSGRFPLSLFGGDDEEEKPEATAEPVTAPVKAQDKAQQPDKAGMSSLVASLAPGNREPAPQPAAARDDNFVPPLPALRPQHQREFTVAALDVPTPPLRPRHRAPGPEIAKAEAAKPEANVDLTTTTASLAPARAKPAREENTRMPLQLASLGAGAPSPARPAPAQAIGALGAFAPSLRYDAPPVAPTITSARISLAELAELRAPDQAGIGKLCETPERSQDISFAVHAPAAAASGRFDGPAVRTLPVQVLAAPIRTALR